jgi:aminopeptidase-like protein
MDYQALRPHLHSLPEMPHAIPYLTSYYNEEWGFCLTHEELMSLPLEGNYEVFIDTDLRNGFVKLGEAVLPGESNEEILFSTYLCHPSMANNELSGPLVMAFLYEKIAALPRRRYTYRFVIGPETIGALCYLHQRGEHLKKCLKAGYVITCIGDSGKFTYKKSRQEDSLADRVALSVLCHRENAQIIPFDVSGSDERQYCSPGFNLPVGSLMRTRWGHFPEYHTSLDDKSFISFEAMAESIDVYFSLVQAIEANYHYVGTNLFGEPQLGKRGLYPVLGSDRDTPNKVEAMMWLLNLADGTTDLVGIAERSKQPIDQLIPLAKKLEDVGLLKKAVREGQNE